MAVKDRMQNGMQMSRSVHINYLQLFQSYDNDRDILRF